MTYTTVQGDMWDSIAKTHYGSEKFLDVLINANPQYRDVYIFSTGAVLEIPVIDTRITADNLPPWKKVKK